MDLWAYSYILIERHLDTHILPNYPVSRCFNPNKFDTVSGFIFMIFDIIKVISLYVITIYIIVKNIIGYVKKKNRLYARSMQSFICLFMIALTTAYCIFHFHSTKTTNEILEVIEGTTLDTYEDMWKTVRYTDIAIEFEGFFLILQLFMIVKFLRIIPIFNFAYRTIVFTLKVIIVYLVFLFLVLLCFSVMSTHVWGQAFEGFNKTSSAFIYIMLLFEMRLDEGAQLLLYNNKRSNNEQIWQNL